MNDITAAQTPSDRDYQQAVELLRMGRRQEACALLADGLAHWPADERAWDLLSYAVIDRDKQIYALRRVVQINPQNAAAWVRLADLSRGPAEPVPAPASDAEAAAGLS